MRDVVAAMVALGLFFFALGLISTLRYHQRSRDRERRTLVESGRTVIAEIPTKEGLELFVSDGTHYYWGERVVPRDDVRLVRVLINGSPLVSYATRRHGHEDGGDSGSFADRPEGIAHDRWDVLLRSGAGDVMVECGSIRERVSQELARAVFDAVRADMEHQDQALPTRQPDDLATTPAR